MDPNQTRSSSIDEADLLMINARLRDELEPYRDESIDTATTRMSLRDENEYLESILAWERAPALPIAMWFSPPIAIDPPSDLDDDQLSRSLDAVIGRLASKNIVLRYTDHLSDRQLYGLLYRDILPAIEKMMSTKDRRLEWQCVEDTETFLRYYADPVQRRRHQEEHRTELPPAEPPPHPRQLP